MYKYHSQNKSMNEGSGDDDVKIQDPVNRKVCENLFRPFIV